MTRAGADDGASFLVVNYRTACYVRPLIASIERWMATHRYEVLVCDNSCDRQEEETLREARK